MPARWAGTSSQRARRAALTAKPAESRKEAQFRALYATWAAGRRSLRAIAASVISDTSLTKPCRLKVLEIAGRVRRRALLVPERDNGCGVSRSRRAIIAYPNGLGEKRRFGAAQNKGMRALEVAITAPMVIATRATRVRCAKYAQPHFTSTRAQIRARGVEVTHLQHSWYSHALRWC